ncbi:hypothetical protein JXB11_02625 [Candidatus Woesearchaeota archaeon]|nr:hypothetical protein [Candidatus Woesearchaeota archaeon]
MKGQAEIIGISIVALLTIIFILLMSPRLEQISVPEETDARSLVSIMKSTAFCDGAKMQISDLVRGCVRADCSCRDTALAASLEGSAGGRKYDFEIVKNGETAFSSSTGECKKESLWLPSYETIEVRFGTC